jgi:hypothetical protein
MSTIALKWFLASDGVTPADGTSGKDMSVALVSQPIKSDALGCAFQFVWPATGSPHGAFALQVGSDGVHFDDLPSDLFNQTPTQPTGTADSGTWELPWGKWQSPYIRATYTPSSGGTGASLVDTCVWTGK